jgi:hypothetical protein
MADDNRYYRSDDSYARGEPAAPADRQENPVSDPLAELARLIGQTDPFADLRRQAARAAQQDQQRAPEEREEWQAGDQSDHQQPTTAERDYPRSSHGPAASYYAESDESGHRQAENQSDSRDDYPRDEPGFGASRYDEPHLAEPRYTAPHVEEPRYGGARSQNRFYTSADASHRSYQPARYAEQPLLEPHYESPGVQPDLEAAQSAYDDDRLDALPSDGRHFENSAFYEGQQNLADDEQDFYEDEPAPRHRKVWMTAAAVCALAVVGSASAFGYRAIFGKTGSSAPPPVITANASPIKVVPPAPAADPQAGKINYDRFGDKGQGEKVVVREEQPVDVNAIKPEPPRPAPNPVAAPNPAPAPSPPAPPTTTAAIAPLAPTVPPVASSAPSEPKKVRTVTIKPEQASGLDSLSARSAAVQTPSSRTTTAPPGPATPNAAKPSAPIRTASAPPNVRPPAEPSVAGGFMVQVSSQKSEADAKASYKTLQAKFPNQLQNRSAVIRKADVSGKGTFYRAQVGPFNSSDQANEFCKNLQAAGGQCVVQRN